MMRPAEDSFFLNKKIRNVVSPASSVILQIEMQTEKAELRKPTDHRRTHLNLEIDYAFEAQDLTL